MRNKNVVMEFGSQEAFDAVFTYCHKIFLDANDECNWKLLEAYLAHYIPQKKRLNTKCLLARSEMTLAYLAFKKGHQAEGGVQNIKNALELSPSLVRADLEKPLEKAFLTLIKKTVLLDPRIPAFVERLRSATSSPSKRDRLEAAVTGAHNLRPRKKERPEVVEVKPLARSQEAPGPLRSELFHPLRQKKPKPKDKQTAKDFEEFFSSLYK